MSVRAGYGIYDILPLPYLMVNRTNGAPFFEVGLVGNPPVSTFPQGANASLLGTALKAAFVQQNPSRAYNQQWNLTIQRQLSANTILTVGYVGSHGVHEPPGVDDIDLVPPQYLTAAPDGHLSIPAGSPRINPAWGRIPATFWNDVSSYNGGIVDFTRRLSGGLEFGGAYTYAKSIDLVPRH
jgi:hypothetical protein